MTGSDWAIVVFAYYLPYAIAVAIASAAKSIAARRLVFLAAAIMVGTVSVFLALTTGCKFSDFQYQACPYIGRGLAQWMSGLALILIAAHILLMPVLAVLAAVLEIRARRRSKPG